MFGMEMQLARLLNERPTRNTLSSLPHLHGSAALLHSVSFCHFSAPGPFVLATEMAGEVVIAKQEGCEGIQRNQRYDKTAPLPHLDTDSRTQPARLLHTPD